MKIISTAVRPINLLQIIGGSIVGGMENYVISLLRKLPRQEFNVTCLCTAESPLTSELQDMGCTVHITPITDEPSWQSIQLGVSLIRTETVDVIHAHLPNAHTLAGILSRLTETPALATVHGRYLAMRDFEVHRLAQTHIHVVAKTAYFQALSLGVPLRNLKFIANGADTTAFQPSSKSSHLHSLLDLPPDTPLVGFVGRLSPEKAPNSFVQAAQIAHKSLPSCHFVLIGAGPMQNKLKEKIFSSGSASYIHLAGLQRDMPRIYASLDLVVSTSHSEAMPLAIIEAMASGLPVIATNVGGVVDLIETGSNGFLNRVDDFNGIADNIVTLMSADILRAEMGRVARKRAEEKFTLDSTAAQVKKLLGSLVGQGYEEDAAPDATTKADTPKAHRKNRLS